MIEPIAPAPSTAKSNSGMARPCVTASERLGDILQEPVVARFRLRRIALEHLSVAANEEFLEIPADIAGNTVLSGSEEKVHGMALRTVHLELRAEWKSDVVFATTEGCDLRFAARLLPCELVAGEAHHREALGSELALQLLEPPVLRSEPAVAGDVDGERHLAPQCAEQIRSAIDAVDRDVVEPAHGWHSFGVRRGCVRYTKARLNIRRESGATET